MMAPAWSGCCAPVLDDAMSGLLNMLPVVGQTAILLYGRHLPVGTLSAEVRFLILG
jgi:hypothetical protein